MNKNKKFWNRSVNSPIDLSKYKEKWNEILFSIIKTKEFNILNEEYSPENKKIFVDYFKNEIFDNIVYKERISLDDEQKIIINDRANILIQKVLMPLANEENKTNDIYDILNQICTYLTLPGSIYKIFDVNNSYTTGIFNIENVKLICDFIFIVMSYYDHCLKNKMNFRDLFNFIKNIKMGKEEHYLMMYNSSSYNNKDDEDDKGKEKELSGYYYICLINKIFKLNENYIPVVSSFEPILCLITKIKKSTHKEIRKIIYEIILFLLEKHYSNKIKKENSDEKKKIINRCFEKDPDILYLILEEKIELFNILIELFQYNNKYFSKVINIKFIYDFFDETKKKKKLSEILNILFRIINIKDKFTMDRLYLLMGFPEMIIKNKKVKVLEEQKEDNKENINIKRYEEDEDEDDKEESKNIFTIFPKFGYSLAEENKDNEIFKYRGNYKSYETHCILAQLFPCSESNLYSYKNEKKKKENKYEKLTEKERKNYIYGKLTEKERKNYIYKLLTSSLLGEGNYALFKYIYLTQSRFIKYKNLYEEIIDILSEDKDFDLGEIKKNGEIYIKRINIEIKKLKKNISEITHINLDSNENQDDIIPDLPENIKLNNESKDEIEEFTGFYPSFLPDKISKVEYVLEMQKLNFSIIFVNYFTTIHELNKKEENKNNEEESKSQNINKDEIINEKDEKNNEEENEKEDDEEQINSRNKIFYRNKIDDNEEKILKKLVKLFIQTGGNIKKITIINEIENNLHKKIKEKITLKRAILYSENDGKQYWEGVFEENEQNNYIKYNYYFPGFSNGNINIMDDLLVIYRRNILLDFITRESLKMNLSTSKIDKKESNGLNDSS